MSAGHARKGGEVGINRDFYKGGQYLPSSENTVKGMQNGPKKGTKKQIAPYTWGVQPEDNLLSIYDRIEHSVIDNRKECQYVKGQGFTGIQVEVLESLCCDYEGVFHPEWYAFRVELARRFNSGERWFPMSEDPFYYLNQK